MPQETDILIQDSGLSIRKSVPLAGWAELALSFVNRAVGYSKLVNDPRDIHEAWTAFRVWLSPRFEYGCQDWGLFLAWYVFHWKPVKNAIREKFSLAELYAAECPAEVSEKEKILISEAVRNPLDFYEIYWLSELNCYYVKSLFLGYQNSFAFHEMPAGLEVGDVFFGKIVPLYEDRGIIVGHSRPIGGSAKVAIAYLRRELIRRRKSDFINDFYLFDSDIFNLYHDLLHGRAHQFEN
jgi:hypothetical protein